jgi:hypothetical protein
MDRPLPRRGSYWDSAGLRDVLQRIVRHQDDVELPSCDDGNKTHYALVTIMYDRRDSIIHSTNLKGTEEFIRWNDLKF